MMNDFQIISKLGEGAYSTVFKVKRNQDNMIYALKKVKLLNLSSKEKENSLNEVRILASVKSNFVVSYKEAFFDEKDNTLCIVMEFADNGDLYQQIVQHKKSAKFFEESDIWRIFIQLVKGLKALHDLKILHRDMKSANVFLFSNGSAKLGDLNVSKVAKRGLGYTQTGTPYYASPEVWKDKPYDKKSDIWSLGCVLYEMITLRPPFRAQDMEGLYNKVCKGQYSKIPDRFSDDLFQVVQFLLQVNPSIRPSCEDILNHEAVKKRIEYFKSFAGEDENEDICLLKTIRMPKNLLFLSDKLPKPNYDKQFKSNQIENNEKNYRSFNKPNNNTDDKKENEKNVNVIAKKPIKLVKLEHIPEEKEKGKENEKNNSSNHSDILNNKESNRQNLIQSNPEINILGGGKSINPKVNLGLIKNKSSNNNNKIILKKEEKYYLDLLSKQKNELRKLELKNNVISKRLNYINNNNSQINSASIKELNKIVMPNLVNKSVPKKINNYNIIRNEYYIKNPPYLKNLEDLEKYKKKNLNKLDYDYGKNYNIKIINNKNVVLPKIPRRLSPINKYISLI